MVSAESIAVAAVASEALGVTNFTPLSPNSLGGGGGDDRASRIVRLPGQAFERVVERTRSSTQFERVLVPTADTGVSPEVVETFLGTIREQRTRIGSLEATVTDLRETVDRVRDNVPTLDGGGGGGDPSGGSGGTVVPTTGDGDGFRLQSFADPRPGFQFGDVVALLGEAGVAGGQFAGDVGRFVNENPVATLGGAAAVALAPFTAGGSLLALGAGGAGEVALDMSNRPGPAYRGPDPLRLGPGAGGFGLNPGNAREAVDSTVRSVTNSTGGDKKRERDTSGGAGGAFVA